MQVTETSADGLKREFRIVVPAGELEDKVVSRLDELGRTIRLPGFRPGKVPMQMLRRRYGPSVLRRGAGEHGSRQLGRRDPRAQSAAGVAAQGRHRVVRRGRRPRIQDVGRGPARNPGAELCRSRHRAAGRRGAGGGASTPAIERIAEQQRKSEPVERPAESGDILVADVEGRVGDQEIPGASGKDRQIVLGAGSFIPGFEDQLVGAAAGEHRKVRVTFPEDYAAADLAGKEAEFEVDVKEVRERAPVAIDDELGEAVGLENLAELRQEVRQQMERDYAVASRLRLKRALLDKLAERYDFPVPPGMVELEFNNIWAQYQAEKERQRRARRRDDDAAEAAPRKRRRGDRKPPRPPAAAATESERERAAGAESAPDAEAEVVAEDTEESRKGRIPQDCRAAGSARPAACGGRPQQQYYGDPGRDEPGDHPRGAPPSRLRAPGSRFLSPEPGGRGQFARPDLRGQGRRFYRRAGEGRRARGDPAGIAGAT